MTDLHPIKQETFDTQELTNIDPKGFTRSVDSFKETDFGLYMARGANHPRFGYLESWLLPEVGLRANIFHFRDGVEIKQDIYFDVAEISHTDGIWTTRDLYVDLIWNDGQPIEVLDIDELAAATSEGFITAEDAERAIETTLSAVEGITRNNDNALEWLRSIGIDLDWANANEVELVPAES
ncbi:Protein of uncharacterised function (DUF402) [Corynebacterium kutscheri]|uniref:Protein of uncharacterized function (DUF402) n=1 Tax=Corynebacterium kutscheri TaxID=35755 RepID=A0A0F6R181_9CORY|nr:DUF402 domain-containing protein [Corynebacterium kutscheri]AKE41730.1 hypothetical protein UL82_07845 [Corynebacterium kutscheri]VEH09006.1 Protein of uncharacterised function (DUF402) [Corynebacterium kutscheri]VEH10057.1 Protein of uncharacterised function (DUF402) [Corynebacterium kutscheri]VEH80138.1 Protein of uncharacterised function (DUF402) [Corynebacterium kutscheri]